jgi:hypothetical protein
MIGDPVRPDAAGERAIVSEGYATAPRFSRDRTRVFYLLVRDWWLAARGWMAASAELRSVDLASGKSDSVLSGVSVTDYEISRDEKEVAYTTTDSVRAFQNPGFTVPCRRATSSSVG